jgi:hypothetical protein
LMASLEGVICTSNGSFKDALGTACFTILGPSDTGSIICPMILSGGKEVKCIPMRISSTVQSFMVMIMPCARHTAYGTEARKEKKYCDGLLLQSDDVDPSMQQINKVAAIRTLKIKSLITWMKFRKAKQAV